MEKIEKNARVIHKIEPVWDSGSKILILGTMPSPASRKIGFFYMHAQNRFWQIMERVFDCKFSHKNDDENRSAAIFERKQFLLKNHIAMWDVLAECEIEGAKDSSIKKEIPNDFSQIFSVAKIEHIFCTGKTAFALYEKHCAKKYDAEFSYLPSTSPANRALWNTEKLAETYKSEILRFVAKNGETP